MLVHSVDEISELDMQYIAEQIKQGYTCGLFEAADGENRISWTIEINKFNN